MLRINWLRVLPAALLVQVATVACEPDENDPDETGTDAGSGDDMSASDDDETTEDDAAEDDDATADDDVSDDDVVSDDDSADDDSADDDVADDDVADDDSADDDSADDDVADDDSADDDSADDDSADDDSADDDSADDDSADDDSADDDSADDDSADDDSADDDTGVPVVLVPYPHISGATVIEVDDEYVYWTSTWVGPDPADPLPPASGSYVLRIPKEGGTPEAIYEAPAGESTIAQGFFALSDTSVYILRGVDIYVSSLIKVAKDGSSAVEIAQPAFNTTGGFAIDSQSIYFGVGLGAGIQSVPLDGGPVTTVVDASEMAQKPIEPGSGNEVPWEGHSSMVSDGTHLYFNRGGVSASNTYGHMMQVPVGGGVPRVLFQGDPTAVNNIGYVYYTSWPCVTGGFVYWQTYGWVFKTSIDEGGTPTPVVTPPMPSGGSGPQTLTDGDYLYYLDASALKKVSVDGGTPVTIAEPGGFSKFAIDDTSAYLIGADGQQIVKVPK